MTEAEKQIELAKKAECPWCADLNIEYDDPLEMNGSRVFQDGSCRGCRKKWREWYELTEVEELES